MYNQAKSCVSANDTCSNYFSCSIELFTLCMLMTQSFYLKQSIIYKTLLIFMKNIVINKNSPPIQLKQRKLVFQKGRIRYYHVFYKGTLLKII
ncbi:hypothetical protein MAR_034553, partial [Mya arenaria]